MSVFLLTLHILDGCSMFRGLHPNAHPMYFGCQGVPGCVFCVLMPLQAKAFLLPSPQGYMGQASEF